MSKQGSRVFQQQTPFTLSGFTLSGFTLIELILFIMITGLLASALLASLATALRKAPVLHQQYIALQSARRCMDWLVGQRRMKGFSVVTCPSTAVPAFCTVPSGFTLNVSVTCTTLNSDTNYKTVAVTVGGAGNARLSTLLAAF